MKMPLAFNRRWSDSLLGFLSRRHLGGRGIVDQSAEMLEAFHPGNGLHMHHHTTIVTADDAAGAMYFERALVRLENQPDMARTVPLGGIFDMQMQPIQAHLVKRTLHFAARRQPQGDIGLSRNPFGPGYIWFSHENPLRI